MDIIDEKYLGLVKMYLLEGQYYFCTMHKGASTIMILSKNTEGFKKSIKENAELGFRISYSPELIEIVSLSEKHQRKLEKTYLDRKRSYFLHALMRHLTVFFRKFQTLPKGFEFSDRENGDPEAICGIVRTTEDAQHHRYSPIRWVGSNDILKTFKGIYQIESEIFRPVEEDAKLSTSDASPSKRKKVFAVSSRNRDNYEDLISLLMNIHCSSFKR